MRADRKSWLNHQPTTPSDIIPIYPSFGSNFWVDYNTTSGTLGVEEVSDYGIQLIPSQTVNMLTNRRSIYQTLYANNRMNFQMPLNESLPMADADGVPGQGVTDNPLSLFENHQFVRLKQIAYDPSYGQIYGRNIGTFVNSVSAVYYVATIMRNEVADGVDYNDNGIMETNATLLVYRFDPHPLNFELVPKASKYNF